MNAPRLDPTAGETVAAKPVLPLDYLTAREVPTPWLLSRIGLASIFVGVFSAVFGMGNALYGSRVSTPIPLQAARVPGVFVPPTIVYAMPDPVVKNLAYTYSALAAVISLLGFFLVVAGYLTLRQSRRWRLLHLVYAVIAPALCILSIIIWFRMTPRYLQTYPAGAPFGPATLNFGVIAFWVINIIYPLLLLVLLRSKAVRRAEDRGMLS